MKDGEHSSHKHDSSRPMEQATHHHHESGGEPQAPGHQAPMEDHSHARHAAMDHAAHGQVRQEEHPLPEAAGQTMASHAGHGEHAVGHGAHVSHAGHEALFRRRFWVSLALSIPVLVFSSALQQWLRYTVPVFAGSQWIPPVFAVVIFFYGGIPFLQMAVPELRSRRPGMMTLISLAITVAFIYSLASLLIPNSSSFFWELVTLIDIMLLGHWLEMRSVRQASRALDELAKLMPDMAERIRADGSTETVRAEQLSLGDRVLVRPGTSIPADGEVETGESDVNEAMITGESRPVGKVPGRPVIAGTINGAGSLRVRVTATGGDTALAGIMRLVQEAQQTKSHTQMLADRAAGWLFYIALAVAAITGVGWSIATGVNIAVVERVATVLVIACPHALGLAIPLVVAITTALGASNGILVRDRLALELAREVDVVVFDKTGTLTRGEFGVVGIAAVAGWSQDQTLALAAAVEGDSEHTMASAVRRSAEERHLQLPGVSGFEALQGRGVQAMQDGHRVHVGGPRLLEALDVELPFELEQFTRETSAKGQSVVYLIRDSQPVAALALADVIRPESRTAVERLHKMGIEVAMLTGDSEAVARAVAQELGIDHVFAQVLPENKDEKVAQLQQQGRRVAMVGDGVNDAPALTRADVGIAIGSGTDVAIESAGIILVKNNVLDAVRVILLSRASYRKMVQNLIWATGYNVIALPLAAGVLAPAGVLLSPALGALFMSLSTIVVAINAQLLRRLELAV